MDHHRRGLRGLHPPEGDPDLRLGGAIPQCREGRRWRVSQKAIYLFIQRWGLDTLKYVCVDMRTAMDLITPRGSRDLMSSQTGTREHTTLSVGWEISWKIFNTVLLWICRLVVTVLEEIKRLKSQWAETVERFKMI